MNNDKRQLAAFLKEVAQWEWSGFLKAESDPAYTTRQSIVFAMIRAAAMEDIAAISIAINRLDGKVEMPVQVVYPKVYYLYPNATEVSQIIEGEVLEKAPTKEVILFTEEEMQEEGMPSHSFRETMEKMAGMSLDIPTRVVKCQEAWENYSHGRTSREPDDTVKVSMVVAARLLRMAQKRDMKALDQVFDNLDGKLVETIRMVGEDMFLVQWDSIAPAGAQKNDKGVYQIEAPKLARMWSERLDATKKGLNSIIIEEE